MFHRLNMLKWNGCLSTLLARLDLYMEWVGGSFVILWFYLHNSCFFPHICVSCYIPNQVMHNSIVTDFQRIIFYRKWRLFVLVWTTLVGGHDNKWVIHGSIYCDWLLNCMLVYIFFNMCLCNILLFGIGELYLWFFCASPQILLLFQLLVILVLQKVMRFLSKLV